MRAERRGLVVLRSTLAKHGRVDGDEDGRVAGALSSLDQPGGGGVVSVYVELEEARCPGLPARPRHFLQRRRRECAQCQPAAH